jgi:hypothetical protein
VPTIPTACLLWKLSLVVGCSIKRNFRVGGSDSFCGVTPGTEFRGGGHKAVQCVADGDPRPTFISDLAPVDTGFMIADTRMPSCFQTQYLQDIFILDKFAKLPSHSFRIAVWLPWEIPSDDLETTGVKGTNCQIS